MIYHNLDFEAYKKMQALNASKLKDFASSPKIYEYRISNPIVPSASMEFGTMVHKWILERDTFGEEYAVTPQNNKRLKAFKEEYDLWKQKNITLITEEEFGKLKTIDVEIQGENELTIKFERWGLTCKSRFDSLIDDCIWDVKTCSDVSKFERDIVTFKYYLQAGFYSYAFETEFGRKPSGFKFFVVPNKMPYNDYQIIEMDQDYIDYGRQEVESLIEVYKKSKESQKYPRRPDVIAYRPSFLI